MKIKKFLLFGMAATIAYTIVGFWGLPYIAKKKAIEAINEIYETTSTIEEIKFNPFSFELELINLKISDENLNSVRLKLGRLYANFEVFPILKKEIKFQSIFIGNTQVDFKILNTGLTNWTPKNIKTQAANSVTNKNSKPWVLTLNSIELAGTQLNLSDFTHRETLLLPIGPINLKAENISTSLGAKTDLETLNISFGNTGSIILSGSSQLKPVFADIKFKAIDIPLNFLSSYLSNNTLLDISSGQYSGQGQIIYKNGTIQLKTNSQINDFKIIQDKTNEKVAEWKTLTITNLNFQSQPRQIRISAIDINGLNTGIILKKSGRLNFKEYLHTPSIKPNPTKTIAPDQSKVLNSQDKVLNAKSRKIKTDETLDLVIDKLTLEESKIYYSDQQIKPNFSAQISNLNGTISPITLMKNKKTFINLKGRVEAEGQFNAKGYYLDNFKKPDLNLKMSFNNIEMTTFTPYSGKFAGYEINKGKLFLDLNYTLKNNLIRGSNNAVLDQFTLGNKVESETASNLPLKLALALLKDRDGKIKINLPVEGDVNSPKFKMSELIWTAIKNVIVNIAAAPFDFLKGLLGGGDKMDSIYFNTGTIELLPEQDVKIQQLANFLAERPQLNLEIQGRYLPMDLEALKKISRKNEITEDQLKKIALERGQKVMSLLVEKNIAAERLYLLSSTNDEISEQNARVLLVLKNSD